MAAMLANAASALRPGGRLLVRDHGRCDLVQLRIPPSQCVGPNAYVRGDGTRAYFYSPGELSALADAAGLRTVDCRYVCVANTNKKKGLELRRVFVSGAFEKPAG